MMGTRKIAVYARVSSAEQARPDATSIDKQLQVGQREADRIESFLPGSKIVKTYIDAGVTGSSRLGDRPEGERLLQDARRGKFDTVVFYSLDRFTRSVAKGLADFEYMEDELELFLVFAKENIDTSQPSGRLFRTILMSFAEFEREVIRDRSMAGRYGKAMKGGGSWPSGMAPYGYEVIEGRLAIREDEAEVVRTIFEMRSIGLTMAEIARHLNARRLAPRPRMSAADGKPIPQAFSSGSIYHYLNNRAYKGEPLVRRLAPAAGQPREAFEYEVPAIVTDAQWARARSA
jgi:site-specific DNA recombinase